MKRPSRRLRELVPGIYLGRDSQLDGHPFGALLEVFGTELDRLDHAIRRLLDDHFVERASPEALPLLADLFAAHLLGSDARVNRAVVACAVAWRRRRGTLPTIEEVLRLTTGWTTEVEEAYRSLQQSQDLRHPVPWRGRTSDLTDPISLADPLSRRIPPRYGDHGTRPRWPDIVSRQPDEWVDDTLRRLGRADAGRHAISPRTVDLDGWARPDVALVRTSRFVTVEYEGIRPSPVRILDGGHRGLHLDPLDRKTPLVWPQPLERPDRLPTLTDAHEPPADEPAPVPTGYNLLTQTTLALDPQDAEDAGALTMAVEGIPFVGPRSGLPARAPLEFEPVSDRRILRFAEPGRPSPGDVWSLALVAGRSRDRQPVLSSTATRGHPGAAHPGERAAQPWKGATLFLEVALVHGGGARREADGSWTRFAVSGHERQARSHCAVVGAGDQATLWRVDRRRSDANAPLVMHLVRLEGFPTDDAAWTDQGALAHIATDGSIPADRPGLAAVGFEDTLFLVGDDGDGHLGVWSVRDLAGSPAMARIDRAGDIEPILRPLARRDPTLCVRGTKLYVFGGSLGGAGMADDLWSLDLAQPPVPGDPGRRWTPRVARGRGERTGGVLLSTDRGLVLLGGLSRHGELERSVVLCDPDAARRDAPCDPQLDTCAWEPLPELPIAPGQPGRLVARAVGNEIHAVVWDDHTRPVEMVLDPGAVAWSQRTGRENGAPNPPAAGEAVFVADELVCVGPSPLPPSEVIISHGRQRVLAFLPEIAEFDRPIPFHLYADGSTVRSFEPGDRQSEHDRPGPPLLGTREERTADRPRLGIPGRLGRHFFGLRQRSLGPWDGPISLETEGVVSLDPRLGRVILPAEHPPGVLTASFRAGRGDSLGAGLLPPDRMPPGYWQEPGEPAPSLPDLPAPLDRSSSNRMPRPLSAWISEDLAGRTLPSGSREIPVFANPAAALAHVADPEPVLAILGSAHLEPARLAAGVGGGLSLISGDFGSTPFIEHGADGVSVAIHPHLGGQQPTDVWLAGLWAAGRLDLVLAQGTADIRWCTIGRPGETAIRVAGGGHQRALERRSIPDTHVTVWLYGCQLGAIQLPPWVRLVAGGCTFDAGSDDGVAIEGAGCRLVLRHCTVRGQTQAGEVRASSTVFSGPVTVDRPDLGWIRYSLLAPDGRPPRLHRSMRRHPSFGSHQQPDPTYLVLAENNGVRALSAGEHGRQPGAFGGRADRHLELDVRTEEHLPMTMVPVQVDRAVRELTRMNRRTS